jgi:hypothetical protein
MVEGVHDGCTLKLARAGFHQTVLGTCADEALVYKATKKKGGLHMKIRFMLALAVFWGTSVMAQQAPLPEDAQPKSPEGAQTSEPAMTLQRLAEIVQAIDPAAVARGPALEFTLDDIPVIVIADARADRMRAMVPIASADGLEAEDLLRLMQANFDAALDARYAIANGRLWGVFIHPLSPLEKDQFLSGLVQTITVAKTYGTGYTSGGAVFGGGDSNGIYQELLEELREKGQEL